MRGSTKEACLYPKGDLGSGSLWLHLIPPSRGSQRPTTLLTNFLIKLVLTENLLQMTKRAQLF